MGRGGSIDKVEAVSVPLRGADPDGFEVIQPGAPPDIGSEAHRIRLEEYARARTNRFDVRVSLSHFCGRCRHDYEDHESGLCGVDGCGCDRYVPGGGSFTDMAGNITVQSDVPPDGSPAERELCIRGLLRHEIRHETTTDPDVHREFVKELTRLSKNKQEITANQLKQLWNILEDGMIEERERAEEPGSYAYISALNKLHPRVGKTQTIEEDAEFPAPDGYIPRDADGNELEVVEIDLPDGSKQKIVKVPAGTRLSPWGKCPISPQQQIEAALLAEAIPEFEPGELHPDVQDALDECREHIDAAVRGNTADCVARAYAIHGILRQRGLLREDLSDEEREALEKLSEMLGQMMPSAPDVDPDGQPQGGGQSPMNGMPSPVPGQQEMSDEMKDALGGGGDGQEGEEEQDGQGGGQSGDQQKQQGNAGGGQQQSAGNQGQQQQGDGAGDGKAIGDNQAVEGRDAEKGQSSAEERGGFDAAGGYDSNRPLPQEARRRHQSEGRGSVSKEKLDEMLSDAKDDLDKDKANQRSSDTAKLRRGQVEADQWKIPNGHRATPQREIAEGVRRSGQRALPDEQGELSRLGRQLSARLRRVETRTRAPQRRLRRGKLDSRRAHAAMAFNDRIFLKKGEELDLDMEIDVSIDRSGSVTGSPVDNTNQYRMAKMFGEAAKLAKIPMSIYGWDGSGYSGGTNHYAFKEKHSDDLTAIDGLFQSGGGGTPTAEGVAFSRARLRRSKAKQKIMIVITDGVANEPEKAREAVEKARREGIKVVGMAFGVGSGCSPQQMDDTFGPNNWMAIENYTDAPRILGDMIMKTAKAKERR